MACVDLCVFFLVPVSRCRPAFWTNTWVLWCPVWLRKSSGHTTPPSLCSSNLRSSQTVSHTCSLHCNSLNWFKCSAPHMSILKRWLVFLGCWFRGVNNVTCHQFSSLCHRVQWKHCSDPLLYLAGLVQAILMSVGFLSYDRSTLSLNPEPCISVSLLSESHWLPRPWFFPFRDRSVILVSFLACHWEPICRLTCGCRQCCVNHRRNRWS